MIKGGFRNLTWGEKRNVFAEKEGEVLEELKQPQVEIRPRLTKSNTILVDVGRGLASSKIGKRALKWHDLQNNELPAIDRGRSSIDRRKTVGASMEF